MARGVDPLAYCLRLIKTRQRTVLELDQSMARQGVEPERRKEVLDRLAEVRLIDDRAYARSWVRTRDRLSPRGEAVLAMELRKKGVPDDIAGQVLAERRAEAVEDDNPDDVELGKEVLRRKERLYASLAPDVRYRRQVAALQRRGFSYETIKRILSA